MINDFTVPFVLFLLHHHSHKNINLAQRGMMKKKQPSAAPTPKPTSTSKSTPMPVWISDEELDPVWLQDVLKDPSIIRASVKDISNATRRGDKTKDGATLKVTIARERQCSDDADDDVVPLPDTMVLKQTLCTPKGFQMSRSLGLAREALFCKHLAPKMNKVKELTSIPTIYYAHGDMETGKKIVLMEDLSSSSPRYVDSGILFGPGNPNNWKRDLNGMITKEYGNDHKDTCGDTDIKVASSDQKAHRSPPSGEKVAHITFKAIARVHARFWTDASLINEDSSWLRGSNWIQGQGEDAWNASQGYIRGIYEGGIDDKLESWDPLVKATLDHAMAGISWQAQLERLNTGEHCNWTLVHGDFWPGNVLISTDVTSDNNNNDNDDAPSSTVNNEGLDETRSLRILDWEMVGIGSGPQDLGQYILSNMSIEERRGCEERIVRGYWEELVRNGVDSHSFPWEECWREYRIGGVERFLWFLVHFCGQPDGSPLLKWGQFFHDQIAAFLKDHDLKPTDFTQPRP